MCSWVADFTFSGRVETLSPLIVVENPHRPDQSNGKAPLKGMAGEFIRCRDCCVVACMCKTIFVAFRFYERIRTRHAVKNNAMTLTIKTFATGLLALCTLTVTPITHADSDHEEILALYQGWIRAVEGSDIDGYVNGLHPDISLRPPGVAGLNGRENYRVFLGPVFETAHYEMTVGVPHMMGDAAVVKYDHTIKRIVDSNAAANFPEGALEGESTRSHYIDFVARDDSGAWKIRLQSWSMTL